MVLPELYVQQAVAIDPVTKNEIEGGSPMGYNF